MNKSKVQSVLAPYCPPLSLSQVEAIATEIAEASAKELAIAKKEVVPEKAIPVPRSAQVKKTSKS